MVPDSLLKKLGLVYEFTRVLFHGNTILCRNSAGFLILNTRGEPLIEKYYDGYYINERNELLKHYIVMESDNSKESTLIDLRTNNIIWVGVKRIYSGIHYDSIVMGTNTSGIIDTRNSRIKLETPYTVENSIRGNYYVLKTSEDTCQLLGYNLVPVINKELRSVYSSPNPRSMGVISILTVDNVRLIMKPTSGEITPIDEFMEAALQSNTTGDRIYIKGNKVITFDTGAKFYVQPITELENIIKLGYTTVVYNNTILSIQELVEKISN